MIQDLSFLNSTERWRAENGRNPRSGRRCDPEVIVKVIEDMWQQLKKQEGKAESEKMKNRKRRAAIAKDRALQKAIDARNAFVPVSTIEAYRDASERADLGCYLPSLEEIWGPGGATEQIQARWTDRERASRYQGQWTFPAMMPEVDLHGAKRKTNGDRFQAEIGIGED